MYLTSAEVCHDCAFIISFQAKPIMEWFSNVAASAVTDKKFEPVPDSFFVS